MTPAFAPSYLRLAPQSAARRSGPPEMPGLVLATAPAPAGSSYVGSQKEKRPGWDQQPGRREGGTLP